MTIDEEIKTSKFKSEIQKAHLNIIFTAACLKLKLARFLKPYNITMEQFNVLRIVNGQYPNFVTVKSISQRMLDRSSNATRIIDKLVKKELLNRSTSEKDRREMDISITESGIQLIKEIDVAFDINNPHTANISDLEGKTLNSLLDAVRECCEF